MRIVEKQGDGGNFGKEHGDKLLVSVWEVYRLRNSGQKEIDAGIKILTDKIIGHPEQEDRFVCQVYACLMLNEIKG